MKTSREDALVVSPTMVLDDLRQCERKDHIFSYDVDNKNNNGIGNENDNENDSSNRDGSGESESPTRKKLRFPNAVAPMLVSLATTTTDNDSRGSETREQQLPDPSPPRRWWFSRHSLPVASPGFTTNSTNDAAVDTSSTTPNRESHNGNAVSGMVLSEHLGRASDVVESLTHDVHNWSLTRLSVTPAPAAAAHSAAASSSTTSRADESVRKKEKQKRCKDAQRQVRMARRRFLEEQKRQIGSSSTNR